MQVRLSSMKVWLIKIKVDLERATYFDLGNVLDVPLVKEMHLRFNLDFSKIRALYSLNAFVTSNIEAFYEILNNVRFFNAFILI